MSGYGTGALRAGQDDWHQHVLWYRCVEGRTRWLAPTRAMVPVC